MLVADCRCICFTAGLALDGDSILVNISCRMLSAVSKTYFPRRASADPRIHGFRNSDSSARFVACCSLVRLE